MGLDKAIEHNKEYRQSYRGSKAIDYSCRNHGSCDWCKENRAYKNLKREEKMKNQLKGWYKEND